MANNKLVYGVGVNDLPGYWDTKFYITWLGMLKRCYSNSFHVKYPTYIGCSVCDEWLIFSNFKKWMETQDWKGKYLDKDILTLGNKIYSPETCMFVNRQVNNLFYSPRKSNSLLGCSNNKLKLKYKYRAQIQNTKNDIHLGYFSTELEAHRAWQLKKAEYIKEVANAQDDEKVKAALIMRADLILEDHKKGVPTVWS